MASEFLSGTHVGFFAVGPQRTASSWLYEILKSNDEFILPTLVKETMFFDQRYDNGLDWYYRHFDFHSHGKFVGEVAPTYFSSPEAPARISSHFSTAKIVIAVRNPIERCHSLFRHHLSKGRVPDDFDRAIAKIPDIVESGHYKRHSLRWETEFGTENLKYILQEDVESQPEVVLGDLGQFLEIREEIGTSLARERVNSAGAPKWGALALAASKLSTFLRANHLHGLVNAGKKMGLKRVFSGGKAIRPLSESQRKKLLDAYTEDIEWLEKRLEQDFSHWRG